MSSVLGLSRVSVAFLASLCLVWACTDSRELTLEDVDTASVDVVDVVQQLDAYVPPPEPQPGFVFLNLTDEAGLPLVGAMIWLGDLAAVTDAGGNARFEWLQPGEWVLRIEHPDYCSRIDRLAVEEGQEVHPRYALRKRAAAQDFDVAQGLATDSAGFGLVVGAGGLVDLEGTEAQGPATLKAELFSVEDFNVGLAPAAWIGVDVDGYLSNMVPLAAVDLELADQRGLPLQPAAGKPLELTIPVPEGAGLEEGAQLQLWSEYYELGGWAEQADLGVSVVKEGEALVFKTALPHLSKFAIVKKLPTINKITLPAVKPSAATVKPPGVLNTLADGKACPRVVFKLTGFPDAAEATHDFMYQCSGQFSQYDTTLPVYYFNTPMYNVPFKLKSIITLPQLDPIAIPRIECRMYYGGIEVAKSNNDHVRLKYPTCKNESYTLSSTEKDDVITLAFEFPTGTSSLDTKLDSFGKNAALHVHCLNGCPAASVRARIAQASKPLSPFFDGEVPGHRLQLRNLAAGDYLVRLFNPANPTEQIGPERRYTVKAVYEVDMSEFSFGVYDHPNQFAAAVQGGCRVVDCLGSDCNTCVQVKTTNNAGDPVSDEQVKTTYQTKSFSSAWASIVGKTSVDGLVCMDISASDYNSVGAQQLVSVATGMSDSQKVRVVPQTSCAAGNCAKAQVNVTLKTNQCPTNWKPIGAQTRTMGFRASSELGHGNYPPSWPEGGYLSLEASTLGGAVPAFVPGGKTEIINGAGAATSRESWEDRWTDSLVVMAAGPQGLGLELRLAPETVGADCPPESRGGTGLPYTPYSLWSARTFNVQRDFPNAPGNTAPYILARVAFDDRGTAPASRLGTFLAVAGTVKVTKYEFLRTVQYTYDLDLAPEAGGAAQFKIKGTVLAPFPAALPQTLSNVGSWPQTDRTVKVETDLDVAYFGPTKNDATQLPASVQQCLAFTWWQPGTEDARINYCVPPTGRFRLSGNAVLAAVTPFTPWYKYLDGGRFALDGNSDQDSWMYTAVSPRWFDVTYLNAVYEKNGLGTSGWGGKSTVVGMAMRDGVALAEAGEVKLDCGSAQYIACHLLDDFTCGANASPAFAFLAIPPDLNCTMTVRDAAGQEIPELRQTLRTMKSGAMTAAVRRTAAGD